MPPSDEKQSSPYHCAGCGLSVAVVDGTVIRACSCDAPVTASMQAQAKGNGGLKAG